MKAKTTKACKYLAVRLIFGTSLLVASSISSATNCGIVTTALGNILIQNGVVYVYTLGPNNCGCANS